MVSVSLESVDIGPVASRLNVSPLDIGCVPALSPFTLKLYISGRVNCVDCTPNTCPSALLVIVVTAVNVSEWSRAAGVSVDRSVLDTLL